MKAGLFITLLILAADAHAYAYAKDSNPVMSEALKVAKAAHLGRLRDATSTDVAAATTSKVRGSSAAMVAIGVGQATGAIAPPPGLSPSGVASLSIASAFLTNLPVGYPDISPRLLVWMPIEMAATPEAARDVLHDILLKAVEQTVPEAEVQFVPKQRDSLIQSHISIVGHPCANCRMTALGLQDFVLPKVEKTPDFLGGEGQRYAWGHPKKQGDGLLTGYPWADPSLTPEQRQAFLIKLSSNLPPWMYLYLSRDPALALYPQMLHEGKVLVFLEPGADLPALVESERAVSQ